MQKLTSEKHATIWNNDGIPTVMLQFEEFALVNGIPRVLIHQIRLILIELLQNILKYGFDADNPSKINLQFKMYDRGRFSMKITHRGVAYNPFESTILGYDQFENDLKIDTLGFHLARKYMDQCSYHFALNHNIIFLSKERV